MSIRIAANDRKKWFRGSNLRWIAVILIIGGVLAWQFWPDPHAVWAVDAGDTVTAVAFSPNGSTVAVGLFEGRILLLDAVTGALRRTLTGHTAQVLSLAFAADGRDLISGANDGTVRRWTLVQDAPGQIVLHKFQPPNDVIMLSDGTKERRKTPFYQVTISPDGRTIAAGSDDGKAYVVDRLGENERSVHVGSDHTPLQRVTALGFTSDSSHIVLAGYDQIVVAALTATTEVSIVARLPRLGREALLIRMDSADKIQSFDLQAFHSTWSLHPPSATSDEKVHVPPLLQHLLPFGKPLGANCAAFSSDGRQIAFGAGETSQMLAWVPILGAHDARLFVVRVGDTMPWLTLKGHSNYVLAVAWSLAGDRIVSGGADKTVRLWRIP